MGSGVRSAAAPCDGEPRVPRLSGLRSARRAAVRRRAGQLGLSPPAPASAISTSTLVSRLSRLSLPSQSLVSLSVVCVSVHASHARRRGRNGAWRSKTVNCDRFTLHYNAVYYRLERSSYMTSWKMKTRHERSASARSYPSHPLSPLLSRLWLAHTGTRPARAPRLCAPLGARDSGGAAFVHTHDHALT